ncbi:12254_t:CDS:10 [Racocetra fulgida]|uniref:12254_t:CDS:1 n=1 Tax=Racocetra fulgida TaxID=60492 RepID=A0A9N9B8C6_9GLOM|nr:12254_t:CDS:10 [Racocetra fulgida]
MEIVEENNFQNISNEIPDFLKLINELKIKAKEIKEQILSTTDRLDGKSISDHPVISNLVELRVVLEKIKPVEQKLKYQIDKLIRATIIENITEKNVNLITHNTDPLSFKPNPQDFVSKVDDDKNEKEQSRLIARASKSRIMKDLIEEYDDKPEEFDASGGVRAEMMHDKRIEEKLAERNRYEEENFVRLPIPKNELKKLKNSSKKLENDFENLNDFNSLATIQEDIDSFEKQRTNVLVRRNVRNEMYEGSDNEEFSSKSQSNEKHVRRNKPGTFNGLLDDGQSKQITVALTCLLPPPQCSTFDMESETFLDECILSTALKLKNFYIDDDAEEELENEIFETEPQKRSKAQTKALRKRRENTSANFLNDNIDFARTFFFDDGIDYDLTNASTETAKNNTDIDKTKNESTANVQKLYEALRLPRNAADETILSENKTNSHEACNNNKSVNTSNSNEHRPLYEVTNKESAHIKFKTTNFLFALETTRSKTLNFYGNGSPHDE